MKRSAAKSKGKKGKVQNDGHGFVCVCYTHHKFPAYFLAHKTDELSFTCSHCGRKYVIYDCEAVLL